MIAVGQRSSSMIAVGQRSSSMIAVDQWSPAATNPPRSWKCGSRDDRSVDTRHGTGGSHDADDWRPGTRPGPRGRAAGRLSLGGSAGAPQGGPADAARPGPVHRRPGQDRHAARRGRAQPVRRSPGQSDRPIRRAGHAGGACRVHGRGARPPLPARRPGAGGVHRDQDAAAGGRPGPGRGGPPAGWGAEPVAVVIADDPYVAEDAAEAVDVEWTPLQAIADLDAACAAGARQVHGELSGNCLVDLTLLDDGRLEEIFASAPVVVGGVFTSARVAALPMEGRACLADWDDRDEQVVVHISTQVPHQVRSGIAQALGIPERGVRVIAPDVGGGFGLKCVVGREEVVVAGVARRLRQPVSWIEDRQENLTASFHGHEQRYDVRAAFDADGRILGLAAEIDCDVGAYSAFPFTCAVEPLMAASELPGVYKVPAYRAHGRGIASNKAPTAPYRGVSRPQIVLVMEQLMERAARALGMDPIELRRVNMISPGEFP